MTYAQGRMDAIVIDDETPGRLRWTAVPVPVPRTNEVVIQVEAVSVNPGEVAGRIPIASAGEVPGWEAAGTVVVAAADGSGPEVGTRVTSFGEGGAWASYRAVSTDTVGAIPNGLDAAIAATIPVSAASALRAIRALGGVVGTRLMVTGATGSVGRYAVQVGRLAGADVVAVARDRARHDELRGLGAAEVVADPGDVSGPVDNVIETVGAQVLAGAFGRLAGGGTLITLGRASGEPTIFRGEDLMADHGRSKISIRTFFMPEDLEGFPADLAWLATSLQTGVLQAQTHEAIAIAELPERVMNGVNGKIVARISH